MIATGRVSGDFLTVKNSPMSATTPNAIKAINEIKAKSSCYFMVDSTTPGMFSTVSSAASPVK